MIAGRIVSLTMARLTARAEVIRQTQLGEYSPSNSLVRKRPFDAVAQTAIGAATCLQI